MSIAFILHPFRRGFFCNDESIQLPYFDSTVSDAAMYGIGLSIPVLLIFLGEYVSSDHRISKYEMENYFKNVYRKVICFGSGVLYEYLIVSVGKVTASRLRPNFIEVCGINVTEVCRNKTYGNGYISNYTCPNGDEEADYSRVSFPSGHAGFSFYAAVFTVLYLQKRLKFGTLFWKPLLQFAILLLAWWVSLTRIMDNKHHLIDVIAGMLIGSGVAIINTIFAHSFFKDVEPASISKISDKDSTKGATEKQGSGAVSESHGLQKKTSTYGTSDNTYQPME